ncbi:MAG: hypothetical protein MK226_17125 [Saprospiraceae bacterium]|nr:hypothetical protein [Saprospiraceae bacterium]
MAFWTMLLAFSCSKDATITAELEDKSLQALTALDVKQVEVIREEIECLALPHQVTYLEVSKVESLYS